MASTTYDEKRQRLKDLLEGIESQSQLECLAVVTWAGIRIASAESVNLDADEYSAASAAMVSLGEMTVKRMNEGRLIQVVVRGDEGYTILTRATPETLVVAVGREQYRLGYYLGLLVRTALNVAEIVDSPTKHTPGEVPLVGVVSTPGEEIPAAVKPVPEAQPIETPTPVTPSEVPVEAPSEIVVKPEEPAVAASTEPVLEAPPSYVPESMKVKFQKPKPPPTPVTTPTAAPSMPQLQRAEIPVPMETNAREEERKAILEALKVIGMLGEEPQEKPA